MITAVRMMMAMRARSATTDTNTNMEVSMVDVDESGGSENIRSLVKVSFKGALGGCPQK